ncbi:hypothetical protein [Rubrivirga sp. IMCC43871]|uniref:hypothetical protein n=1 Tax=Rubrivirga sp. IMCC43871 TaxID=3391575 RepID=UPI00398FBD6E
MSLLASLLLGALLGVAYTAAALLVARRASAVADGNKVLQMVLGGMLARMALMLAAFAAILALVPVQRGPFVLGLGVVFVIGLVVEVFFVLGRTAATPGS